MITQSRNYGTFMRNIYVVLTKDDCMILNITAGQNMNFHNASCCRATPQFKHADVCKTSLCSDKHVKL